MLKVNLDDTIAAISTSVGESGIGIVRMSGPCSLSIADRIFHSKDKKRPSELQTYTTHYGRIRDGDKVQDEVILTVMRSPKSYTKEDIVEINCHGGIVPLKKVLDLVVSLGARLAEPGEFTKRAYLNGRIDLAQAEAVLDVIRAKTDISLTAALEQLTGRLSAKVRDLREGLVKVMAHVEASIDFPEEDLEIFSEANVAGELEEILKTLQELIATAEAGKILRDGIATVICGKPNVGKSSLMNALLREHRVIVTPIPGTTRDTIEETVNLRGVPIKLVDTAGIFEGGGLIERESIARSRTYLDKSDLIILIFDGSIALDSEDLRIIEFIKGKKIIVAINKIDLPMVLDITEVKKLLPSTPFIKISASQDKNIDVLEKTILELVWSGVVTSKSGEAVVTNARHKEALIEAEKFTSGAIDSIRRNRSGEFIALDVRGAIDTLGRITGETVDDEVLDMIFSEFCIGK